MTKREKEIEKCVDDILSMLEMFQDMRNGGVIDNSKYSSQLCLNAMSAVVTLRRLALGDPL